MKGLIIPKNEDNECFRWCIIRHLNPKDNHTETIKKSDYPLSGIEFPVTIKQMSKIETQNSININAVRNKQAIHIE